jgi:hypothetical protein
MLFTVPSIGGFYRKPYVYQVLKILTKKSEKQENSSLFMKSISKNRKMRIENQTLMRLERP